jgi:hypothetical protein
VKLHDVRSGEWLLQLLLDASKAACAVKLGKPLQVIFACDPCPPAGSSTELLNRNLRGLEQRLHLAHVVCLQTLPTHL